FSFLFVSTFLFSQNERLIIGRTTGKLSIGKKLPIRTFGFTNSLSGQVTLPGSDINVKAGDSVHIDFWNISQGNPVSLYCREIDFEQRNTENEVLTKKEPVHHMVHGFYSFQAQKTGTYLYYSPENYPFNLQAGMFGVIIVSPEGKDSEAEEKLWCSFEIDTKWHTDAIMGTAYDDSNKPVILPDYKPDYFLINGQTAPKTKGLQSLQNKKGTVLLRLVNAGLYLHEIQFPAKAELQLIFGKTASLVPLSEGCLVKLHPGECLELLVSMQQVTDKEKINYHFIDPILSQVHYSASIPVFY
ncbi:MAG: multicopper oxidase domain-containing protein, partial [Flavobacterium sp.]